MSDDASTAALKSIAQQLGQVVKILSTTFPQQGGVSATATGGAATLPGNPVGFIAATLPNGTAVKIPYYAT